jgi:hypothetical protein
VESKAGAVGALNFGITAVKVAGNDLFTTPKTLVSKSGKQVKGSNAGATVPVRGHCGVGFFPQG